MTTMTSSDPRLTTLDGFRVEIDVAQERACAHRQHQFLRVVVDDGVECGHVEDSGVAAWTADSALGAAAADLNRALFVGSRGQCVT